MFDDVMIVRRSLIILLDVDLIVILFLFFYEIDFFIEGKILFYINF